ncbi:MAG TPA: helix-turn-helix domain-containing protein [Candidatus Saccharimonadales bacterium]|nr:helix-turn-helix domain-containing protein [Candidatus Saccharimonadales bacterium]
MDPKDPDLFVIGRFARLVGLSVGALRHYDELDLLRPAVVDRETGYRSYRRDQLEAARTIVRLRDLEVPLETIRAYLGTDDPAERRRVLLEHRGRIEARVFRLQGVLHVVGQLAGATDPQETLPMTAPTLDTLTDLDGAMHRRLGVALFNHTWTLLEQPDRSAAETDEMIHSAHASRFHWSRAEGQTPANLARGEWQCSRVYAVLGRGEPALWHARRCVELLEAVGAADWDIASAYEAMARASAIAGDRRGAVEWKARAVAALDGIADQDDRDIIENDIATLPI